MTIRMISLQKFFFLTAVVFVVCLENTTDTWECLFEKIRDEL
jgi:hypothetical protein